MRARGVLAVGAVALAIGAGGIVFLRRDAATARARRPPSVPPAPRREVQPGHVAGTPSPASPGRPAQDPVALLRRSLLDGPAAREPVEDVFARLHGTSAPPAARRLYLTLFLRKDQALPLMVARLRSGTTEEKAEVISLLARYFLWREPAPLVAAVGEDPGEPAKLRLRAFYAAHCLGRRVPTSAVVAMLDGARDPLVRELALELLGALGDREAVSACRRFVGDGSPRVRLKAAAALGRLGDPSGMGAAVAGLQHEDWAVRKMAAEALGAIGSEDALIRLRARLAVETDPSVRVALARGLHEAELRTLGEAEQMAYLEALVGADEWAGRWALERLFREHRSAALPALRRLALRRDRRGHAAAVYALFLESASSAG